MLRGMRERRGDRDRKKRGKRTEDKGGKAEGRRGEEKIRRKDGAGKRNINEERERERGGGREER